MEVLAPAGDNGFRDVAPGKLKDGVHMTKEVCLIQNIIIILIIFIIFYRLRTQYVVELLLLSNIFREMLFDSSSGESSPSGPSRSQERLVPGTGPSQHSSATNGL